MITSDNEVGSSKVLADDGVPDGLTRTGHTHGEGEEGEGSHSVGVGADDGLVDTDTGEGVNISGCGKVESGVSRLRKGGSGLEGAHAWSGRT